MHVYATVPILLLALAGCAATAPTPSAHSAHDGAGAPTEAAAGKGGGMKGRMDEMCSKHAAEPGRAASAPGMMAKHCQARAEAAAGAASGAHSH
ncbi:hypothetical protein [Roseateles sp. LYH14W]|uniref:Uncharacterized protein n=1 Tax=Pelomonas parva TaxID=3299032 RepID=A0ABW7F713_9BURK